ncbi:ABC transporter related protein [Clostridium botulinum BKT015925]|nr:ABC transporter related protein [Clostridium botulinum BKT015925]
MNSGGGFKMELVRVENLCKSYGKGEAKVEALKDINMTIKKGEFVAIVGPSGSRKSTLLHLLGGVDIPTSGKVILDGVDIYSLKERELSILRRRKIGFIFQFYNLLPVLTAKENIEMPVLLDGKKVDESYMEELLNILGMKERQNHLPSELSGGQQQRVSIGRALANKPSIIFADEPTGNLDSKNSKEIIELLRYSVKKYNQTLVLITHDLNIASIADRVITIEDGDIKSDEVIRNE